MQNVKIIKIRESGSHPGIIYADLVEAETGRIIICATLIYIFQALRERKDRYNCLNVETDCWGDFQLKDYPPAS